MSISAVGAAPAQRTYGEKIWDDTKTGAKIGAGVMGGAGVLIGGAMGAVGGGMAGKLGGGIAGALGGAAIFGGILGLNGAIDGGIIGAIVGAIRHHE